MIENTLFDFQAAQNSREAHDVRFMYYTAEEIRKTSVQEISQAVAFSNMGQPFDAGVHSPALGYLNAGGITSVNICKTCGLGMDCPGHMGHIELATVMYNPFLMDLVYKLLGKTCLGCNRLKASGPRTKAVVDQLARMEPGGTPSTEEFQAVGKSAFKGDCGSDLSSLRLLWQDASADGGWCEEILEKREQSQHAVVADEIIAKCTSAREKERKEARSKAGKGLQNEFSSSVEGIRAVVREYVNNIPHVCQNCGEKGAKWSKDGFLKLYCKKAGSKVDGVCPAIEARSVLRKLWETEKGILRWWVPGLRETGPDVCFLETLVVPPNRFRPTTASTIQGGGEMLGRQSVQLNAVLQANDALREAIKGKEAEKKSADAKAGKTEDAETEKEKNDPVALLRDFVDAAERLQDAVNSFMDSTKGTTHQKLAQDGIRQLLEKKAGLFRMKMMGKRVNFAARSVISPDLNIGTNEIGVPLRIASELTYPEVATSHNIEMLRKLVIRGDVFPGASEVHVFQRNGGKKVWNMNTIPPEKREAIASQLLTDPQNPATVFRHIRNGDPLLVNRQPTLHKPGIMAHKVRVLRKEKTIRMHYANCNTYNADFDGDEMNLHAPQDPFGRIEALNIARADRQYLVPTSGKPLRGLIQDHVIAGVMLTKRDTYFTKSDVCLLLYTGIRAALEGDLSTSWDTDIAGLHERRPWDDPNKGKGHIVRQRMEIDPPTLFKPKRLWTGKQVFSMLLKNLIRFTSKAKTSKDDKKSGGLNFDSVSKTPGDIWNGKFDGDKEEATVMFRDSSLLMGVLDKQQFGATSFSMMHLLYEFFGPGTVDAVFTSMARLYSLYLQMRGFTCAFADLVLKPEVDVERRKRINESRKTAKEVVTGWLSDRGMPAPKGVESTSEEMVKSAKKLMEKEGPIVAELLESAMLPKMKNSWGEVVNACFPAGTKLTFPKNCFAAMVQTGAKGSKVNQSQVTCCLGQQELEGRQPPLMTTKRSLPCFAAFDLTGRTRGYITDRFLTGIRPQEFFFHCMAGREGLVDTAVKTSRSGYLQRCLVKHLECLKVSYDLSVRDADGSIVQFLYGEDGLEVTASTCLYQFDLLRNNFHLVRGSIQEQLGRLGVGSKDAAKRKVEDQVAAMYLRSKQAAKTGDLREAAKILQALAAGGNPKGSSLDSLAMDGIQKTHKRLLELHEEQETAAKDGKLPAAKITSAFEPITALLTPAHFYGATCEKHEEAMQKYIDGAIKKGQLNKADVEDFTAFLRVKFMQALAQPGEAVGVIAAQGMGEPCTQMTLNTFHLAGHGGANVTLGIPRMREIIQTAARSLSTPLMKVEVVANEVGKDSTQAKLLHAHLLKRCFRQTTLLECIKRIVVHDKTRLYQGEILRVYHVRLQFWPLEKLTQRVPYLSREKLEDHLTKQFLRRFTGEIARLRGAAMRAARPSAAKGKKGEDEGEEVGGTLVQNEDGEEANDASGQPKKKKAKLGGRGQRDEQQGEQDNEEAEMAAGGEADKDDDSSEDGSGMYSSVAEEEDDIAKMEDVEPAEGKEAAKGEDDAAEGKKRKEKEDGEEEGDDDDAAKEGDEPVSPAAKKRKTGADTGKTLGLFEGIDLSKMVKPGRLVGDEMAFTVSMKHRECPHRLLIPEVVHDLCEKEVLQDPRAIGVKTVRVDEEIGKGGQKNRIWLECEGVNLHTFHTMPKDTVDVDKIQTNDIMAVFRLYGIEAARAAIVKEIRGVFGHYGIEVNHRHLYLIGDYMTQNGNIKGFNRLGLQHNMSPLQQMSYETTMQFMNLAAKDAVAERCISPSSSIVVGNLPQLGTGIVQLLCDLEPSARATKRREFKFE
eukprot:TRINITY_DN12292_c0_g1_i1.p1 TRINITY_DN12292_c0_g1~~TRINITY_DN12292_c0_g1_i1.p1  ORF type:complete len:1825 (-),score=566.53 TRINITY_DN12292_c0_g1_i1:419-5893(-)